MLHNHGDAKNKLIFNGTKITFDWKYQFKAMQQCESTDDHNDMNLNMGFKLFSLSFYRRDQLKLYGEGSLELIDGSLSAHALHNFSLKQCFISWRMNKRWLSMKHVLLHLPQNYHENETLEVLKHDKILFYGFLINKNNLFTSFFWLSLGGKNNKIFQTN